jgi:phage repressor protein C with HTH and peptisase S24 domain
MESTIYERIKERLDALGLTETTAARAANLSEGAIRNIRRRYERGERQVGISSTTADKLAPILQTSVEWIVAGTGEPQAAQQAPPATPLVRPGRPRSNASFPPVYQRFSGETTLPVLGQTSAGPNGRFILNGSEVGRVFTPPMLEGVEGAYAVRVYGTSMEPRYFAGETVWINPREPVRAGDDVVVQLLTEVEHERESYIKKFVSKSAKVTRLYQYNPDEGEANELEYPSDRVFSVHKIVFHASV